MKTILLAVLPLMLVIACSDSGTSSSEKQKSDPPEPASDPSIIAAIPSADELAGIDDLVTEQIEYGEESVTAYPLGQFVNHSHPQLYSYEVMSNDKDGNFSPRLRGMEDLSWNAIESGYLLPAINYRAFFPDPEIFGTYNVRNLGYLRLYRKVDVIKNGKAVPVQVGGLEAKIISYIYQEEEFNDVNAVPLNLLISDYITTEKESYNYLLDSVDSEDRLYSWAEINDAYIVDEKVLFIDQIYNQVVNYTEWLESITLVEDASF